MSLLSRRGEKSTGSDSPLSGATRAATSDHTLYLADIHYDKFEQRSYIKYGNGVETSYTYRPDNRRLRKLDSVSPVSGRFQNLEYVYDPETDRWGQTRLIRAQALHHKRIDGVRLD